MSISGYGFKGQREEPGLRRWRTGQGADKSRAGHLDGSGRSRQDVWEGFHHEAGVQVRPGEAERGS